MLYTSKDTKGPLVPVLPAGHALQAWYRAPDIRPEEGNAKAFAGFEMAAWNDTNDFPKYDK